jgi:hypothetical protein
VSTQPTAGYPHDPQLRARIQAFSPDEPGVAFPFSARLARENGWTRPFAGRMMEEYRRFVYLAMTAGHPVSPSEQVDEVWHLHLTYTRSYWEEMCGRVLGRPLHHEPTRGGRAESAKFVDWYARTLDSYARAFGHAPPPDAWPSAAERFSPAGRPRHVSPATHWIIRKPRLTRGVLTAAVAMGALLLVAACTPDEQRGMWMLGGVVGAALLLAVAAQQATVAYHQAQRKRDDSGGGGGGGGGGGCGGGGCTSGGGSASSCDAGGDCGGGCGGGGCGGGCGGCGG